MYVWPPTPVQVFSPATPDPTDASKRKASKGKLHASAHHTPSPLVGKENRRLFLTGDQKAIKKTHSSTQNMGTQTMQVLSVETENMMDIIRFQEMERELSRQRKENVQLKKEIRRQQQVIEELQELQVVELVSQAELYALEEK